jgi:eukaryotic-like serine/threonine-protein kinase
VGYAGLQPEDPREIGPYRLLGQLGSGGMGQVFLAMSAGGRPIAVKVIRTELATDPDFRGRFRREVAAAQKVSGLFTALVVDADLDAAMPWLATAYVPGPSLNEAVRRHGPLPVRSTLALTAGLAEGLDAIHAAGVVHRDLKPSNVLLAEDGPRVIDFGISEAAEASVAGANVLIGSPGYMSPEQVLGAPIGPASDVFSLGSVLTFASTGQSPFGAGSNAALMYRLVNNPADLSDVPGELRSLVGSCLAKHPGDRPTARELLAEVGALQPAPGWLAESILSSFIQDTPGSAVADPAGAGKQVAVTENSAQPPRPGQLLYEGTGGPGRHRISRTLASAGLTGALVAGSAVAAFALLGANHTPASSHLQPRAGAGAVATSTASASSNPAASPRTSSPAPSPSARVSPAMFLSPSALSGSSGTSLLPTPIVSPSSAPPTKAPPSSTPPSSKPPSSTPPSSTPPSSTPPSSTPPSSTPPSSTPPSSTPPSSTPPSSTPPTSTPASSSAPAPTVSVSISLSV